MVLGFKTGWTVSTQGWELSFVGKLRRKGDKNDVDAAELEVLLGEICLMKC